MLFDPTTGSQLKPWLIRSLEPICDAEPGALADYIDALLRHNVPESEMRKELETQLSEFLEKETSRFVDTLFTVLRTKSYLPYSTSTADESTSSTSGIHIPLDAAIPGPAGGSRKRALDFEDNDGRTPAKGPRLSADGFAARNPSGRGGHEQWGRGGGRMIGHGDNGGPGRSSQYRPPEQQKRGVCRDYYNSGFCQRGAYCKYSHGEDAVVPNQLFSLPGAMSFMFGNGGMPGMPFAGGAYDPHESRMDMRQGQHQKAPVMSRALQEGGAGMQHASGELPVIQDLTPMQEDSPHPRNGIPNQPLTSAIPTDSDMQVDSAPPPQRPTRGGRANRGQRGHGRGTFRGDAHALRPDQRSDKTLVVEKIPEDKLSLDAVNTWFKKFGTVTNVAVDARSSKALVSFSAHAEAHVAWKSEEAVFGNRFVKVFWHRPMAGHGEVGTKALAASAPLVANLSKPETTGSTSSSPAPKPAPKKAPPSAAVTALAEKQRLLDSQIAEQKQLMGSLSTASADEKKDIMARLRKLGEEMKSQSSTPAPSTSTADTHADGQDTAMAQLDKELDVHATTEGQETTEELKATLEKLKAEAASLGISEGEASHPSQPAYRGYRGRGRASYRGYQPRGAFRGGPPRGSMKLDNRPKKLLIKGTDAGSLQSIRDWYEGGTGQPESIDTTSDGEVLISFRTRADAEQAMAKGSSIPLVGPVDLSWSSANPPAQERRQPAVAEHNVDEQEPTDEKRPVDTVDADHEEEISGGWGDADIGM